MELPECPVCLQPYDVFSTIPRVLPCGHSACETCLTLLPKPSFAHTIRCPACTQLVNFPQDPSFLPKNIDLLRLSSLLQPENSNLPKNPLKTEVCQKVVNFIPNEWSYEFYSNWRNWVVPKDAILVESSVEIDWFGSVIYGRIAESEGGLVMFPTSCLMKVDQRVSLVGVGFFMGENEGKFNYSYVAKIMSVLHGMRDGEIRELGLMLESGLKQRRSCKVFGLWYNEDDQCCYVVSERYNGKRLDDLENEFFGKVDENINLSSKDMSSRATVGLEICEAISDLHSNGLILGGLALSCFNFDQFSRVYIDFNEVLVMGRKVRKMLSHYADGEQKNKVKEMDANLDKDGLKMDAFVSPELLFDLLHRENIELVSGCSRCTVGYGSDTWSLACVLIWLLIGRPFSEEMHDYYSLIYSVSKKEGCSYVDLYSSWREKISALLENRLDSELVSFKDMLCKCLSIEAGSRPAVTELWRCIRNLIIKPELDMVVGLEQLVLEENTSHCLVLGELCRVRNETNKGSEKWMVDGLRDKDESGIADKDQVGEMRVDRDLGQGLSGGHIKSIAMKGHLDCVTGFAIGGEFLFSSSFDKTVHVWSLKDFSDVHSFKGHEHKVMAVTCVDGEEPLCISGDSGSGICIWDISVPLGQEPIKKLYEEKDWRYTGIHALVISGTGYFYTGSGDRTIKAWALRDYTLSCTMTGHKSVVSTLAVCNGVLYSGSWDGTVRLWCLSDHSALTVIGEEITGNLTSVLSLAADQHVLIVGHENGSTKLWRNDVFIKTTQAHSGAIFSVAMDGKLLFTGGWDKTINIQELSKEESEIDAIPIGSIACDSVITTLLYWQGKLFVGQADRIIKVHYYGM